MSRAYSDAPSIEVALDKERVKSMGQDEKLNVLVDIAFANHITIRHLNSIMIGDVDHEGICDTVRMTKKAMLWLWGIFCGVSGAFFTVLVFHLAR